MTQVRQRVALIHGHRRAYRIGGSGPALLLIHGMADNSSTFEPILERLAERYTVIVPDLLGHGLSGRPRADYSLPAFANAMRDLLLYLGVERATLVGHSLGGGIAGQFTYQFPHMVERLVFVDTGGVTRSVSPCSGPSRCRCRRSRSAHSPSPAYCRSRAPHWSCSAACRSSSSSTTPSALACSRACHTRGRRARSPAPCAPWWTHWVRS
ncbi:alpha/beta fold hydrolase [Tsukamurella sp. PLM1]|uniref:alpha/beta fold hydrolase n=1 Tax=Tsukamurella sp. PLM1 TaxID=2929795 RepID=UPI002052F2DE|nr:alpha/beta fold hydrolase [Tsukamurella sp. PLM1]BDH57083.1 hypothetical protein MTP03_20220 [Tsukamurella sp. PLM1]